MKIIKLLKIADYATLLNALCGFLAIIFFIKRSFLIGSAVVLLGVLFDFLDGKIARMTKQSGKLGKDLDSLADLITFGIAIAVFGYTMNQSLAGVIAYSFFVLCGVLRLARFNAMPVKIGNKGMPITVNGILFPAIYFLGKIGLKIDTIYYPLVFLLMGVLMISGFEVKEVV